MKMYNNPETPEDVIDDALDNEGLEQQPEEIFLSDEEIAAEKEKAEQAEYLKKIRDAGYIYEEDPDKWAQQTGRSKDKFRTPKEFWQHGEMQHQFTRRQLEETRKEVAELRQQNEALAFEQKRITAAREEEPIVGEYNQLLAKKRLIDRDLGRALADAVTEEEQAAAYSAAEKKAAEVDAKLAETISQYNALKEKYPEIYKEKPKEQKKEDPGPNNAGDVDALFQQRNPWYGKDQAKTKRANIELRRIALEAEEAGAPPPVEEVFARLEAAANGQAPQKQEKPAQEGRRTPITAPFQGASAQPVRRSITENPHYKEAYSAAIERGYSVPDAKKFAQNWMQKRA